MKASMFHGLLVLDKPLGLTSRDAVNRALGWFPRGVRMGHTGTLDPLASGVLVLCLGMATRLAEYVQRMEKVYQATIRLGATSDTDDAESAITLVPTPHPPERGTIEEALPGFLGEIAQVPPEYSASKVTGRRAYALARAGKEVVLESRPVRIDDIIVLEYAYPYLELEIRCGRGTYIRSLARDLGERLGTGGMLAALRRTRVGHFEATAAVALEADVATARAHLLPIIEAVRGLPSITLPKEALAALAHGLAAPWPRPAAGFSPDAAEVAIVTAAGNLFAVARVDAAKQLLLPYKVLGRDAE